MDANAQLQAALAEMDSVQRSAARVVLTIEALIRSHKKIEREVLMELLHDIITLYRYETILDALDAVLKCSHETNSDLMRVIATVAKMALDEHAKGRPSVVNRLNALLG